MRLKSLLIPVCQTDSSMSCHSLPRSIDQGHDTLSKSQLIQEQQTVPEISKLIFRALPEDEISQVPMCYYRERHNV